MTLELITSKNIDFIKEINIPRNSNVYEIDFKNNKVNFFDDNSKKKLRLMNWEIPKYAKTMDFYLNSNDNCKIIIPRYYDKNGKLLKIGNH